jgi:predicted nucleic acid-binding protein
LHRSNSSPNRWKEIFIHAVAADPDDNKYIEAAVEGLAQFVVTGDKHLLSLKPYENIRIVTPRVFLDLL